MPRKASWPPKIQHTRAGYDRIRIKGVDYSLGRTGSPEAKREYARLVLELAKDRPAEPVQPETVLTVEALAGLWQVHSLKHHAGNPQEGANYGRALAPVLALFGSLPAAEFDADRLESARERMTGELHWCRTTANRHVNRIRAVWRWAERKKLVPAGNWAQLRTLEALRPHSAGVKEPEPVKPCSEADTMAVAAQLGPSPRGMLLLGWYTGGRPGEFRLLRVGEVDRSAEEWVLRPAKHKCAWRGQERAIMLGAKARELLVSFLVGKKPEEYVFPSRRGQPYTREGLCNSIKEAADRAGVRLTFYQTRHARKQAVTRALGLDAARAALGQKSLGTTNGYAAQNDEELARQAARKCG